MSNRYGAITTGYAYHDAKASFIDLAFGRPFGEQACNTSSTAWQGILSAMTGKQVQAISKETVGEINRHWNEDTDAASDYYDGVPVQPNGDGLETASLTRSILANSVLVPEHRTVYRADDPLVIEAHEAVGSIVERNVVVGAKVDVSPYRIGAAHEQQTQRVGAGSEHDFSSFAIGEIREPAQHRSRRRRRMVLAPRHQNGLPPQLRGCA